MNHRKQLTVYLILLVVYALSAFATYAFFMDELVTTIGIPMPDMGVPDWVFGLANAGSVFVIYGLLGLAGFWFALKLGLPGIFSEDGNWQRWFFIPLAARVWSAWLSLSLAIIFRTHQWLWQVSPSTFPISILASLSAGIGEEIMFRGFVFGLWGFILNWLFKRFNGRTVALWIANVIAALAFGAGHLGTLFFYDRRFIL